MTCSPLYPADGNFTSDAQATWSSQSVSTGEIRIVYPSDGSLSQLDVIRGPATLSHVAPAGGYTVYYKLFVAAGYLLILDSKIGTNENTYQVSLVNYRAPSLQERFIRQITASSPPAVQTSPGDGKVFLLFSSNRGRCEIFGLYRGDVAQEEDPLLSDLTVAIPAYWGSWESIRGKIERVQAHGVTERYLVIDCAGSANHPFQAEDPIPSGWLELVSPTECTQFSARIGEKDTLAFELRNTGDDCLLASIASNPPFHVVPPAAVSLAPGDAVPVSISIEFRPMSAADYETIALGIDRTPTMGAESLSCVGVDRRVRFVEVSDEIDSSAGPGERLEWGFKLQYSSFHAPVQATATFDLTVTLAGDTAGDWPVRIYQDHPDPSAQTNPAPGVHKRRIELSHGAPATWFVAIKTPSATGKATSFTVRIDSVSSDPAPTQPEIWARAQPTFTIHTV